MIATPQAIKLAFTQAASRWATGLFAALAAMAEAFAGVIGMLGALSWISGHPRLGPIAMLAAVLSLLASRIMLAFVLGGAIRHSAAWLKGVSSGTSLEEMFSAAPRSLAWFVWTLPIELLGAVWKWLGLAALVWAYGRALGTHHGGAGASFTLALFLTLGFPLAIGWSGLRRAALVASVRDDVGPFTAAARALAWISARPGAYFSVLAVGLLGAGLSELLLSIFGSAVSPDSSSGLEPLLATQLVGGVLAAFTGALFDLVILYGFTALESEPAAQSAPAVPPPLPPPLPQPPPLQPATPL